MTIDFGALPRFLLGINWRTTAGSIVPILTSGTLIAKAVSSGQWPSNEEMAIIGSALSLAWTAIFAKDKTVTGGTISNVTGAVTPIPVSLVDMTPAART